VRANVLVCEEGEHDEQLLNAKFESFCNPRKNITFEMHVVKRLTQVIFVNYLEKLSQSNVFYKYYV
jgi:hypothetical protein